jgi:hypothetical protein
MKRLILLLLLSATSFTVFSQLTSQVQAKRGVFTEQLYLNGQWINKITTDMNSDDTTSDNVISTAKAVADYIRSKITPSAPVTFQDALSAGTTLTKDNFIYGGNNDFVWNTNLSDGSLYRYRISNSSSEYTSAIYGQPNFNTATEFLQSRNLNSLIISGDKLTSQINQWKDGGMFFSSRAHYTGASCFLIMDTSKIELVGGKPDYAYKQHKFHVTRDSISLGAYMNKPDGTVYIAGTTNLILRGLPAGSPAYDLQTNNNGTVIQKVAPKVYTALLTRTGTNEPVATILGTNSLGVITWTRTATGNYAGTLSNAFPVGKTFVIIGDANDYTDNPFHMRAFRANENEISVIAINVQGQYTDEFNNVPIEIRVYP